MTISPTNSPSSTSTTSALTEFFKQQQPYNDPSKKVDIKADNAKSHQIFVPINAASSAPINADSSAPINADSSVPINADSRWNPTNSASMRNPNSSSETNSNTIRINLIMPSRILSPNDADTTNSRSVPYSYIPPAPNLDTQHTANTSDRQPTLPQRRPFLNAPRSP